MYSITIDSNTKIVNVVLCGFMGKEELISFTTELNSLLSQLKEHEYSMCADFGRLDPIPQDSFPFFIEASGNSMLIMKKLAAVHHRTVTEMQMRRIESIAKDRNNISNDKVFHCKTLREAMTYLNCER
ncbi:MAG: hypothetical protein H6Q59_1054 [Firmicutes bacterium]|nr:hypothetical protein [Bacillota bacterium]